MTKGETMNAAMSIECPCYCRLGLTVSVVMGLGGYVPRTHRSDSQAQAVLNVFPIQSSDYNSYKHVVFK